jgi:tRNA(Ile)-lysidine synthase
MNFLAENIPLFDNSLLPQSARVLAACSGGADSMAMLQLLIQKGFDVVAAHVNHGLRGTESDGDEDLVRAVCAQHNVPFASRRVKIAGDAANFSESAARETRYAALREMAREYSREAIATGHTATDNLETVLLNVMRGAAVDGLCGIAPQRRDGELLIARPLHRATRDETRAFCSQANIPFRDDSSNVSTRFRRNRVRAELLPLMAQLSGKSESALAKHAARGAALLRDDIAFLNALAERELETISLRREEKLLVLCGEKFCALDIALQRRVLREGVREVCGDLREISSERIEETRRHIVSRERRAVWCWRRDINVEWTGAYSGNRIRIWRVEQ